MNSFTQLFNYSVIISRVNQYVKDRFFPTLFPKQKHP